MKPTVWQTKNRGNLTPQVTAAGANGEYVITWSGIDAGGDRNIFVEKFNADGAAHGSQVKLGSNDDDYYPQVAAVGTNGGYVVTWQGRDTDDDQSIFVQKFNTDGTTVGSQVKLEANDVTNGNDFGPQIAAAGTIGEYVVTWQGMDTDGDYSVFVQKFDADGTLQNGNVMAQSGESGAAYLVSASVTVHDVLDITQAADNLWNSVNITAADAPAALTTAGLVAGTYALYTADMSGNLSAAASQTYQVL